MFFSRFESLHPHLGLRGMQTSIDHLVGDIKFFAGWLYELLKGTEIENEVRL